MRTLDHGLYLDIPTGEELTVLVPKSEIEPLAWNAKICLRTQHVTYVRHIAQRDDVTVSEAIRRIINDHAAVIDPSVQMSRQEILHVGIGSENRALLECLSRSFGLDRSDIVRRMIDKAMTEDPILRLAG